MSRPSSQPRTSRVLARIGVLALLGTGAMLVAYKLGWLDYQETLSYVQRLRASQGPKIFIVAFVAAYGLLTSLGSPAFPFNVAAGVLFGTVTGAALAWTGSMLGAISGYWLARAVGHNEVLRWIRRHRHIDAAVEQARDFPGMLRLRLVPLLPTGVVNFVGGLAKAHFGAYLAATAIGIVPSVVVYSYFADSLVKGVASGRMRALVSLGAACTLLILLTLLPRIVRSREHETPKVPEPGD